MNYKEIDVYQRAYRLALEIHKFSLSLPKELQFDLADQIRRVSKSIPSNIAEGYGRSKSKKDKINYLRNSLGSNEEMLFNLEFMREISLISKELFDKWREEYTVCGK